jgi:hypothetical protein
VSLFAVSLIVLLGGLLGACAGSGGKGDDAQAQKKRLPAYFEEIPADTFFFAGGSEPLPPELVAKALSTVETVREWNELLSGDALSEMAAEVDPETGMSASTGEEDMPKLVELLLEEMGGDISAEGLEKLGISSSPRVAAYSVGTVPVMRVELSDPAKFAKLIDRLEQTYERPSTKLEHQGVAYRRWDDRQDDRLGLLRITENEAILATPDEPVFEIFVPYFVGAKKPAKSLADDNAFFRVVETHGFKRFGAGYVDLEQMFAYSTGTVKAEGITGQILAASDYEMTASAQCKQEYMRLVKKMPRLVGGFRHYDQNTTDVAFGAELEDALARGLAGTVAGTPGNDTAFAQKSLVQVGLGIHLGNMTNFLVEQAREIQMQPFQCEELVDINQSASNLIGGSAQIPPAISQLAGFNVLVRNVLLEWKPDTTETGTTTFIPRVLGALRTDQPEAFMFLVQQFFPMAQQIQARPDGNPVSIPMKADVYEGIIEPVLLMTQRGLAVTVGPNMAEDTRKVLDAEESATSPAFIARLNLGDPAREMLVSLKAIVDKAEADKDARGLSDGDIAGARRAIASLEELMPKEDWAATFKTEFNDFGVLFSYRDQGALDINPDELPGDEAEADFEALERVLGLEREVSVDTVLSVEAPRGSGVMGIRGAGSGGGGQPTEPVEEK